MGEPVKRAIEETSLTDIYIALKDAEDRLPSGTMLIIKCITCLENEHGYKPIRYIDTTTMGDI